MLATGFDAATPFSDMVFAPGCGTLYMGLGDRVIAIRPISSTAGQCGEA